MRKLIVLSVCLFCSVASIAYPVLDKEMKELFQ